MSDDRVVEFPRMPQVEYNSVRVPLNKTSTEALNRLRERCEMSNTDIINRALQLYDVLSEAKADCQQVGLMVPFSTDGQLLTWDGP